MSRIRTKRQRYKIELTWIERHAGVRIDFEGVKDADPRVARPRKEGVHKCALRGGGHRRKVRDTLVVVKVCPDISAAHDIVGDRVVAMEMLGGGSHNNNLSNGEKDSHEMECNGS